MNQQSNSFYQALREVTESNVAKTLEVAETKTNIISKVLNGSNKDNMKVLSIGCNLVVMGLAKQGHDVTVVNATDSCVESINNVFKLPMKLDTDPDGAVNLMVQEQKFDLVLALDQSLTFFDTEDEQKQFISILSKLTKGKLVTSLVDYKNRKLSAGDRVRIEMDIPSIDGMLHKNTIVKILRFIAKLPNTKLTGINANNKLAKKVLEEVLILFNMLLLNLYTKKNKY